MFRKIRSNRNPEATLFTEIKNEFSPFFNRAGKASGNFFKRYPKQIFIFMVAALGVSFILSITVFRNLPVSTRSHRRIPMREAAIAIKDSSGKVIQTNDSFSAVMSTSSKLLATIRLKQEVDALLSKKKLTKQDSAFLNVAIDSLNTLTGSTEGHTNSLKH